MKVYLAGPMRGYPEFNYPAFKSGAEYLRALGHDVFSPAEKDIERLGTDVCAGTTGNLAEIEAKGFDLRDAILDDLTYIIREADAVALLPGWEKSEGVAVEVAAAKFLRLTVWELAEKCGV